MELSGCTGSVLLVQEDYLVIANVGDSPVYIFKDISKDEFSKGSPHEIRFKVE
jgi:serine/threonine protein phosphatase PrpC